MPSFSDQADYGGAMASVYYYMAAPIAGFPDIATSAIFNGGVDAGVLLLIVIHLERFLQTEKHITWHRIQQIPS